jgi:hypothetical protein
MSSHNEPDDLDLDDCLCGHPSEDHSGIGSKPCTEEGCDCQQYEPNVGGDFDPTFNPDDLPF